MKRLGIAEALREGITEEMERDPRVFCIGEDIAVPGGWGGAFTVTLGLEKKFPDRMIDVPIAELGFFGIAVGAALMGMRPIADVQYGDFLFLASDQIINNAAKLTVHVRRHRQSAAGHARTHRRDWPWGTARPEHGALFHRRAWAQSRRPFQRLRRQGSVESRGRDDNPVLIFEHKLLYGSRGARAEPGAMDATSDIPDHDYTVPLDKAVLRREGLHVTILAWLLMLHHALAAADTLAAEGIQAEVLDVRSLAPVDYETIGASVRKTGRVVIVEEGPKTGGLSAELAAGIMERFNDSVVGRVIRVASPRRSRSIFTDSRKRLPAGRATDCGCSTPFVSLIGQATVIDSAAQKLGAEVRKKSITILGFDPDNTASVLLAAVIRFRKA